jgi:uncharacterized protein (TIGR02145 family)
MKTILYAFVVSLLISSSPSCNTSKQTHLSKENDSETNDSLLIDKSANKYSVKKLYDGKIWMTTNLNMNVPDSYCYENAEKNCDRYGRLYTWESAVRACQLLGEGWRLPTDSEWNQLVILYGSNAGISLDARKIAYKFLLPGGGVGFDAVLGGGRAPDGVYARIEAHGFYWTATESENGSALYYNFAKGSQALFQQDGGEKASAFSVRCLKSTAGAK